MNSAQGIESERAARKLRISYSQTVSAKSVATETLPEQPDPFGELFPKQAPRDFYRRFWEARTRHLHFADCVDRIGPFVSVCGDPREAHLAGTGFVLGKAGGAGRPNLPHREVPFDGH